MKSLRGCLAALSLLLLTACGGGGGGSGGRVDSTLPVPDFTPIPNEYNRVPYTVSLTPLNSRGTFNPDAEFNVNHGLAQIKADEAYRHGYFGQGVTIAIIESGFDVLHRDLAGVLITEAQNSIPSSAFGASDAHGTYVGILAAGRRGNNGGGAVMLEDGRAADFLNDAHGVAFSASILAIQNRAVGTREAFERATESNALIVNNSFGPVGPSILRRRNADGSYSGYYVWPGSGGLPIATPRVRQDATFRSEFQEVAVRLRNKDQVFVWAAGNEQWNSLRNPRLCGKERADQAGCPLGQQPGYVDTQVQWSDLISNFDVFHLRFEGMPFASPLLEETVLYSLSTLWSAQDGTSVAIVGAQTIYADLNDPGNWANAPGFEEDLIGKWLVVGSVDRNTVISHFSNGCGAAKNWCIVAPGEGIGIGPAPNGTSWSAPMASGALAVLKSRMPNMSMEVVLAALLTSATPLGTRTTVAGEEDIPDDIYGWGLVNLSNAINLQDSITLVSVRACSVDNPCQSAMSFRNARAVLPPYFANLKTNLQNVQVAVGGIGGAYFNAPLSGLVAVEVENRALSENAAAKMLTTGEINVRDGALFAALPEDGGISHFGADVDLQNFGEWRVRRDFCANCITGFVSSSSADFVSRAPFFADGEDVFVLEMRGDGARPFAAFGGDLPYQQFGLRFHHGGRIAAAAEVSAISESRSVLGADFGSLGGARANTAAARLALQTAFGEWRGFAGFAAMRSRVSAEDGMLRGIDGLRAREWSAGVSRGNVFAAADELRFSFRRAPAVSGFARFRSAVASGSFADAFYNKKTQTVANQNARVSLSGGGANVFSLGYARPFGDAKFAVAVEHDSASDRTAFSAALRAEF